MRVLLVNPPYLPSYSRAQRSPAVTKSGTLYYPIWLAYATGYLEQAGFYVSLIDAPAAHYTSRDVLQRASLLRPRLIVVDTTTASSASDIQLAAALKNAVPNALVVLVGPHASALPAQSLAAGPRVDAVARGEYDQTLRDLAVALDAGVEWQGVAGLTYRPDARAPTILHTPDRPLLQDLDALPFVSQVYHRHLSIERYFYAITQRPVVAIIGGRGCPYRCSWCLTPQVMFGHDYRTRSVANLVEEMLWIASEMPQVREVFLEDDTFTVDAPRVAAFCEALISAQQRTNGRHLAWTCNARADMDHSLLPLMRRAGCRMLCVGFESADKSVLRSMQKGLTSEAMLSFSGAARRAGVSVHGCFLIGGRGETAQTAAGTVQLATRLNPQTAQFYPMMVYPGTTAYAQAERDGLLHVTTFTDWLTPSGGHRSVLANTVFADRSLEQFCDEARRTFYLRPGYLWMRLRHTARHPREVSSLLRALRRFVPHLARTTARTAARTARSGLRQAARTLRPSIPFRQQAKRTDTPPPPSSRDA